MHMPFIFIFIMFHLAFSPSLTIKNFFSQTWVEYERNSVLVEKWKGKEYRLVIQRQKRMDGELDLWEGEYTYNCILTNDHKSSEREIVEFYNFGLKATSRIKAFVFRFISVPAKWIKTSRQYVLNIYSCINANVFQNDFG